MHRVTINRDLKSLSCRGKVIAIGAHIRANDGDMTKIPKEIPTNGILFEGTEAQCVKFVELLMEAPEVLYAIDDFDLQVEVTVEEVTPELLGKLLG